MKEIFFVHDQQDLPFHRAHFLESAGYKVSLMQSGQECLQRLELLQPNLILMDILIEGRNGFDTCRRIRRTFPAQTLPIILCSDVYRSRPFRDEAHNAGAQAFLLTPINLGELLELVNRLVHAAANPGAAAQSA
jgi:two-component system, chemotaxis family, response regulator PixH